MQDHSSDRQVDRLNHLRKSAQAIFRASNRQELCDCLASTLKDVLGCKYCGVLVIRAPADRPTWAYASYSGFPDHIIRGSQYEKDEGLTGCTLSAEESQLVHSSDVERDERWSRKFGGFGWLEVDEMGPVSFLGAPIVVPNASVKPFAAMVCLRVRQVGGESQDFGEADREALLILANLASAAFERLCSQEAEIQRLRNQLKVSAAWGKREICEAALAFLKSEFGFERLLLTLVNRNRTQIVGEAVLGFDEGLKMDTRRRVYKAAPEVAEDEDILSVVCRKQIREPFAVNPQDPTDEMTVHLHRETQLTYDLTRPIVYIPMFGSRREVIGVVHGELAGDKGAFTSKELTYLSLCANHLATQIELHHAEDEATGQRLFYEHMLTSLGRHDIKATLRELQRGIADLFRFDRSLVYVYDEEKECLEVISEFPVRDDQSAVGLTYRVRSEKEMEETSLALTVFHSRGPRFVPDVGEFPVDQAGRKRAGLERGKPAIGMPLLDGATPIGVLVVYSSDSDNPIDELDIRLLSPYARIGALVLNVAQIQEKSMRDNRQMDLRADILRKIGRISEESEILSCKNLLEVARNSRPLLNQIVGGIGSLFKSNHCLLYLAQEPICVQAPPDEGSQIDREWREGMREFILTAAHGLPKPALQKKLDEESYRSDGVGLTGMVLRSVAAQETKSLRDDERCSGRNIHILSTSDECPEAIWSWMGVPVWIKERRRHYLLGALTFTRKRHNGSDSLFFADRDIKAAQLMASFLASALYNREVVRDMYFAYRSKMLHWFMHDDTTKHLVDIRDNFLFWFIEFVSRHSSVMVAEDRQCAHVYSEKLRNVIDFVCANIRAYGYLGGTSLKWNPKPEVAMEPLLQVILDIVRAESSESVEIEVDVDRNLRCNVDREKLIPIVYNLILNAVQATIMSKSRPGKVRVAASTAPGGQLLLLCVEDNGIGFEPAIAHRLFDEGYTTSESSTGFGLAIVKQFSELAGGRVSCEGRPGDGARFEVRIPV